MVEYTITVISPDAFEFTTSNKPSTWGSENDRPFELANEHPGGGEWTSDMTFVLNYDDSNTEVATVQDTDWEFKDDPTGNDQELTETTYFPYSENGVSYVYYAGSKLEDEYEISVTDGSTTYRMVAVSVASGNIIGYTFEGDWPPSGTTLTPVDNTDQDSASMIMCFTRGTKLTTSTGDVAIEELQVGDLVQTLDHGLQPIQWIGTRKLGKAELLAAPNMVPIRVRQGALGNGLPEQDLIVSPQHRILIKSQISERMFGKAEVLVAAKHLTDIDGIELAEDLEDVEYIHVLCAQHEILFSNGAATESLYTGPQALKSISEAARQEVFALFPELKERDYPVEPVRDMIPGRKGRTLANRHQKNAKPLLSGGYLGDAA